MVLRRRYEADDWLCKSCKFSNYSRNKTCKNCSKPNMKFGDWICPKCKGIVFSSKSNCRCGGTQNSTAEEELNNTTSKGRPGDWTHAQSVKALCSVVKVFVDVEEHQNLLLKLKIKKIQMNMSYCNTLKSTIDLKIHFNIEMNPLENLDIIDICIMHVGAKLSELVKQVSKSCYASTKRLWPNMSIIAVSSVEGYKWAESI